MNGVTIIGSMAKALPGSVKRQLIKGLYNYISTRDRRGILTFMNYGYLPATVEVVNEFNKARAQLYEELVRPVPLEGRVVTEVSAGRGGGAAYLMEHHHPSSLACIDLSNRAVAFCNAKYKIDGLTFKVGNAEALPFKAQQLDAVVNVEASHNYSSFDSFVAETHRVLKPGGHLLWADMRTANVRDELRSRLTRPGLEPVSQRNISSNVVAALEAESESTAALIKELFPKPLRSLLHTFAGIQGTAIYEGLKSGRIEYWAVALRKRG